MKKIKKVVPRIIDRREFLRYMGMAGGVAIGAVVAKGLLEDSFQPVDQHPDETFFNVMDAFRIPYNDPVVKPFMQPPIVERGTDGCPHDANGCSDVYSNLVKVGDGRLSIVAHEMGHSIFSKYRNSMEEAYFLAHPEEFVLIPKKGTEWGFKIIMYGAPTNPDVEFTKIDSSNALNILDETTKYIDSYAGYPKSKTIAIDWGTTGYQASGTFEEFVADCAEKSVGKHDSPPPWLTDDVHRNGAKLFYHVKDTYGDDAVPLIGGATVMADPEKYDLGIDEVGYGKTVVDSLAKELGY